MFDYKPAAMGGTGSGPIRDCVATVFFFRQWNELPNTSRAAAALGDRQTVWMPSDPTRWRKFPEQGQALPKPGIGYVVIEKA
jgi:hypothetical protein